MTARRLAVAQPVSFELSADAERRIADLVKKFPEGRQRSALIPALWIVQKDAGGWLPEPALRLLGDRLDMAYIRVYEVATFYTMFNLEPVGVHHIQLCGTTPCMLRGSDGLAEVLKRRVGPKGSRSEDGMLSWVEVECLGACVNAPMAQISNAQGDDYYEDLTPESFEALLDKLVAGEPVEAGPQSDRHSSEPFGGPNTLIDMTAYRPVKAKKLPNTKRRSKVTKHDPDPKETRATTAGRRNKPKEPPSTITVPKADHERSVDMKTAKKDGSEMRAPKGERAEDITDRKPVRDADGNPTPDPKGAAVAQKRRGSAAVPDAAPKVLYTDGPTDGAPDDLKRIKGIGSKFESELNAKGVYYYRQIGAWKAADIRDVEAGPLARYPGRIKRDGWVKQAKALEKARLKGAET